MPSVTLKNMSLYIVMGVSGCGKSTVARKLAEATGGIWIDADHYHTDASKKKMSQGIPLSDTDRWPWLDVLNQKLREAAVSTPPVFMACSALKQKYRDRLAHGLPELRFVYLKGSFDLIQSRMMAREGHFMNPVLLQSQFDDLEEPANAIILDIALLPDEMVAVFAKAIATSARS